MIEVSSPERELPVKWIYHSCIIWKINNYFYKRLDRNNVIESPEFQTNFGKPVKWRLILRVSEKFGVKDVTGIRLWQSGSCGKLLSPYVTARLKLKHDGPKAYLPIWGDFDFNHSVALNFIFRPIGDNIRSHFETNLTNSCLIKIQCDMFFDTSNSSHWSSTHRNLNYLSSDLSTFDYAENLTDLDLKIGNERFHVHSTIVKLRSPVVARLSAEKPNDTEIDLSDKCSRDELEVMIKYWYSGNLPIWPRKGLKTVLAVLQRMEQDDLKQYYVSEAISLTTTFKKLNISVTWEIVDEYFLRQLGMLNTKEVSNYKFEQQSWKLYFYPKDEKSDAEYMSLCVLEEGKINSTDRAYLEIFLIDGDGKEHPPQKTVSKLESPGKYVFSNFMSHSDLSNLRPTLLSGNTLRIGCRIEYGTGEETSQDNTEKDLNPKREEAIKHPYEVLADKLKDLLKYEKMSDVTLVTEDGKKLQAHSAILAARSRYFELDVRKTQSGARKNRVIKLNDIKKEDLELILKYMYHAEIDLNLDLAQKLYPSVRKYRVKVLEDLCSEYLQRRLNVDCVLDVLRMADKAQDSPLKRNALEFVVKNFVHISKAEKWQSFRETNPTLAEEITSILSSSK